MSNMLKFVACIMCLAMALGSAIPSFAAWDGFPEAKGTNSYQLFDFNSLKSYTSIQCIPSSQKTRNGNQYSIYWANHTVPGKGTSEVAFPLPASVTKNMENYDRIKMWIYSAKNTGATLNIVFQCPTENGLNKYFYKKFPVDWEGWKLFTMNFSDLTVQQNAEWTKVHTVRLISNGGWQIVGDPETELYIASAELVSLGGGNTLEYYYGDDVISETDKALKNSVVYYAGADKSIVYGNEVPLEAKAVRKGEEVMLPLGEFSKNFGVKVSQNGSSFTASKGGSEVKGSTDSASYTIGEEQSAFFEAPFAENGVTYVPATELAALLGISAYDWREFLVIGDEASVAVFRTSGGIGVNEKREVASYKAKHTDKPDSEFTQEDIDKVKENWRRYLVGTPETNDMSDPSIKNRVDSYTREAKTVLDTLIYDETSDKLFSNFDIKGSAEVEEAYKKLWSVARAYGTSGSEYYHDPEIAKKILYMMEHLYNRYFGIHQIKGDATWKEDVYNWADYDLDCGRCLAYTMLVLTDVEGNLTADDIKRQMAYYLKRNPEPSKTGMNYAEITINLLGFAVLDNDVARMRSLIDRYEKMYFYVDDEKRIIESSMSNGVYRGMGFYTDGSYVLHIALAYNGVYGQRHMASLCMMNAFLEGTAFQMDTPQVDNLDDIIMDSYEKMTAFGHNPFRMFLGRTGWEPVTMGSRIFAPVLECLHFFDEETQSTIKSIVKKSAQNETSKAQWYNDLSLYGTSVFNSILADESVKPMEDKYRSIVYHNNDKSMHEQGDWAVGISMHSVRTMNYECINQQNQNAWYTSDGMTEFYLKDDDTYGKEVFWDGMDPYRRPGTTVDTQERQLASVALANTYYSSQDFVGGATLDDKYGVSAMYLESYHADEPIGKQDISAFNGGPNPAHKNDLTAKKAYFMFDDEVVCLGADVYASDNNDAEVLTVVDNRNASKVKSLGGSSSVPHTIASAKANANPEPANIDANTLDNNYGTKWAAEMNGEIVWDLGEVKNCGFITLAFQKGNVRTQKFTLHTSTDGVSWTKIFDGESSGKTEGDEVYDLGGNDARYVKFTNYGNSGGSAWVSLTEAKIYPVNSDGSRTMAQAAFVGDDTIYSDKGEIGLTLEDKYVGDRKWINLDNRFGYYFFGDEKYSDGELKARWSNSPQSYFELWFSHGINPDNKKYAYVVLPTMTAEETKAYAENAPVTVLENNSKIQAVHNSKLGITGIVFHKPGSLGKISVDKPCIVMYSEKDGEFKISASDPTHKLETLNITINGTYKPVKIDDSAEVSEIEGKTYISIDAEESKGRTFQNILK